MYFREIYRAAPKTYYTNTLFYSYSQLSYLYIILLLMRVLVGEIFYKMKKE